MTLCNILRSPLKIRKDENLVVFVHEQWNIKEQSKDCWLYLKAHADTHTHKKSLWKKCCLTVREWAQQLRHFAKLQQKEGSTTRDIPRCPPTVNSEATAWTDGLGQVAKGCPGSLHTHTHARRWRWEGALGSGSHQEQEKGSSTKLAQETFPFASQSKQQ